jgi:hypothetical protein
MARVLENDEYTAWIDEFLPGISLAQPENLFVPGMVRDRTDGKLVHLDGLNLSRAWCLNQIAPFYPANNKKIVGAAELHYNSAIPNISSGDYAGEHWLASFAVYAAFTFSY